MVDRAAFAECYHYITKKSDRNRLVVRCSQPNCKWGLRAARIGETEIFSIRSYTKMHTCLRSSQSNSNDKRRGSAELVSAFLIEQYPGDIETPTPKVITGLVKFHLGVMISYSTALHGKNLAACERRGSPEDSYKMMNCHLHMVEQVNPGTKTCLKLDEAGKFKYLFIALGACIEGFTVMRKVIIVDATWLKNGYGGVLVFAKAQDPNLHHYPLAFAVLDGENHASWTWFFENLKRAIPDSSELVFMTDRNQSLIFAIGNLYPQAHHGHCLWHLKENVKGHACNVNRDVVGHRFMELGKYYTVADFNAAYESFKRRYPSAWQYVEEHTEKDKWARVFFSRDRYNLDTSNSVESMNNVFKEARRWALIPMLDCIIRTFSDWFNQHRKDAASGSLETKLVPLVENYLHDLWAVARTLPVRELNSYELEYEITGNDGNMYLASLVTKSCSCKVWDYEKFPCMHGLAAYIYYTNDVDGGVGRRRDIHIVYHELCSRYYWTEMWALAYSRMLYVVPDRSS
ncbi:protein FAR1-RELATED SEQUENCE 5-like [Raphanus sativus]|uniref:Protein FAR1-RELATED SEQUENCE 5-like n=1 Tax=Raphanus sativus TaxID=3726 RepID=A0A6J0KM40_RAPSA|nr:protein FAR1-RELATED SEQUENCE 5-like [Raphanus sativus]